MEDRLQMPQHLVLLTLVGRQTKRYEQQKTAPLAYYDDEMSYTIAGTRNRATILSDGQVEVRPKGAARGERTATLKTTVPTTATINEDDDGDDDDGEEDQEEQPNESNISPQKLVIMHIMSDDDDDDDDDDENDDRYRVLEASSTTTSTTNNNYNNNNNSNLTGQQQVTRAVDDQIDERIISNDPSGTAASQENDDDEANQLEGWLDQTMLQPQQDKKPQQQQAATAVTGRIAKKSKIPPQALESQPHQTAQHKKQSKTTNSNQDQSNPHSSRQLQEHQGIARSSPRRRQPQPKLQPKQRPDPQEERRGRPVAPSIAASMSSITPTSTIDEYDNHDTNNDYHEGEDDTHYDDDGASHHVLAGSCDVYSVDSRDKLFEKSDHHDDHGNDKGRQSQQSHKNKSKVTSKTMTTTKATKTLLSSSTTMDKKDAMREYVMNTTHARKLEANPKRSSSNRIQGDDDDDGQDLDDWLDSVIE
jgi:hypothetical protein